MLRPATKDEGEQDSEDVKDEVDEDVDSEEDEAVFEWEGPDRPLLTAVQSNRTVSIPYQSGFQFSYFVADSKPDCADSSYNLAYQEGQLNL